MKITGRGPIGIIGAMQTEVSMLLDEMKEKEEREISFIRYVRGTLNGIDCVAAQCGAGKVNAAVCAQTMILKYNPRLIINTGVAGGLGGTKIGDIVVADACVQHDFDTSPVDGPEYKGVVAGIGKKEIPCSPDAAAAIRKAAGNIYGTVHGGIIATGDCFVASAAKCREIEEEFHAKAVEMEGGGIAHVCCLNDVPVVVLRAISDNANEEGAADFAAFVQSSALKSQELLKRVVHEL